MLDTPSVETAKTIDVVIAIYHADNFICWETAELVLSRCSIILRGATKVSMAIQRGRLRSTMLLQSLRLSQTIGEAVERRLQERSDTP